MLFLILTLFSFNNYGTYDGYYTSKKQLDCVLSSENNINTPNKQGVFILNGSSDQYQITPDHDYYPKNINNQNDLLDNFAQDYLYRLGIKTDLDTITKKDLKFQTCALVVDLAYQKKQFIKNCLDNTKGLRIKVGDIVAKYSCEKAIKAAIHADNKEFESIVKICNNMLSVVYAIGSEVCTNLWSKIQNSTLSSAAQITAGIAFCALAPGLMVGVAGAVALVFASHNCWQKREELFKQLDYCIQAINDDNPERFGREIVRSLDAGGELDIIYDVVLFTTAHRIGSSLNAILESTQIDKIKKLITGLNKIKSNSKDFIKPISDKAQKTANKITDFIIETAVEKTNKVIENSIITFEKTTGKIFSKTHTENFAYIDSADGTIHIKFPQETDITLKSEIIGTKDINPVAKNIISYSQEVIDEAIQYALTPTKMKHILDNPMHNLDNLVEKAGGFEATLREVLNAAYGNLPKQGVFYDIQLNVLGFTVYIRGCVINGVPKIGTMFIK